ncbi:MAG: phosphoribosylglycinamide formyltransferase 1 [Solirubrobacteraceae bacterium]|nr:phosphoribosylglycinamide formyltransferase 1 [Solirubrobacteraceae bacterium]
MTDRLRVGVLVSGTGTNLQALLDTVHGREADVVAVASDRVEAPALERARSAGVDVGTFPVGDHADREARDGAMADWLAERGVSLVVLAGYMQLLSSGFLARFEDAVMNVHPSLLPAFPGVDAIGDALRYGVKVFGVTVHFVDEGVDTGPVVLQRSIDLPDADDAGQVLAALRPLEHEMLPEAVRLFARGALRRDASNPRQVTVD